MGLDEDRAAFRQAIEEIGEEPIAETMRALDDLIAWSQALPWALAFKARDGSQKVVKFVLRGTDTPFWTAYPGKTRPTKLSVIDSAPPAFPKREQVWAKTELAKLDRTQDPDSISPLISFKALRESPDALRETKTVLRELIDSLSPQRTKTILLTPGLPRVVDGKTWLGHAAETGAGKIDVLLLEGAHRLDLEQTRGAVAQHLHSLGTKYRLRLLKKWDHDVFDRRALGAPAVVSANVTRQAAGKSGAPDDIELRIPIAQSVRLPFGDDEKADVTLRIGTKAFDARYHATRGNTRYTYLYQRHPKGTGSPTLGEFLAAAGYQPGDTVTLVFDGTDVVLRREAPAASPPVVPPEASDLAPPPRTEVTVSRIVRDTAVALGVKEAHGYRCQICGARIALPDGRFYAEAHHVRPLGGTHEGPDVPENVLCVCPTHHAELDFGIWDLDPRAIRQVEGHTVGEEYVRYHNDVIRKRWG